MAFEVGYEVAPEYRQISHDPDVTPGISIQNSKRLHVCESSSRNQPRHTITKLIIEYNYYSNY